MVNKQIKNLILIVSILLSLFLGFCCYNYQKTLTKLENKLVLLDLKLKIANDELLKANVEVHRLVILAELGVKNITPFWTLKEQEK